MGVGREKGRGYDEVNSANTYAGVFWQAWLPPCYVLFLPLQHDRCAHPRRVALNDRRLDMTDPTLHTESHETTVWGGSRLMN